jgi:hypothetical protein
VSEFVAGFASTEDREADADATTDPEQTPTDAPGPDPAEVTVSVVNTTAIDGLAAQVSGALTELGYTAGDLLTDPAAAYTSHVAAASADDDAAFAVSEALGGLPVQVDPALPDGSVRVVLAEDYSGPTGDAAGTESYSPTTSSYAPLPPSIADRPTFDAGSDVPCVN